MHALRRGFGAFWAACMLGGDTGAGGKAHASLGMLALATVDAGTGAAPDEVLFIVQDLVMSPCVQSLTA